MSALPYQPVPTLAQRRALSADFHKRHPARQYRDNQAIADFQAARMRYVQPEPALFCAAVDEAPALFGMVDALRAEFGRAWPIYLGTYLILCGLAVVLTLILAGVIYA